MMPFDIRGLMSIRTSSGTFPGPGNIGSMLTSRQRAIA
jgi:hypothetical protein